MEKSEAFTTSIVAFPFGFVVVAVYLAVGRFGDCRFVLSGLRLDVSGGVSGHREGREVRCVG